MKSPRPLSRWPSTQPAGEGRILLSLSPKGALCSASPQHAWPGNAGL